MTDLVFSTKADYCPKCMHFFPKGTLVLHTSSSGKRTMPMCPACIKISKKALNKFLAIRHK